MTTNNIWRTTACRWTCLCSLAVLTASIATSCSEAAPGRTGEDAGRDASAQAGDAAEDASWLVPTIDASADASEGSDASTSTLVVTPGESTITIDPTALDPIMFSANLSDGSDSAVDVRWSTADRNHGEIDPETGEFKPNGSGGTVTVTARAGALSHTATISLVVAGAVEGDPDADGLPEGAGGLGGVGGEGGGSQVTDPALRAALDASAAEDNELVWLYPYDGTVWPRGLPAPLLQWRHGAHAAEAVKIHVAVDDAYRVDVYLGRPNALAQAKPIVRVPLPQAVWRNALMSGSEVNVTLTIAAREQSGELKSYVAARNPRWKVAPTTLRGTLYYNSYATNLAQNYDGAKGPNGRFGGATLAVRAGVFDPVLIAGKTTSDESGCRVCHVVSSNGATLIAQHSNNKTSSRYDLTRNNSESVYKGEHNGKFAWAALSPDGSLALGAAGPPGDVPASSLAASALYRVEDGSVLTAQGLSEFVGQAATPTFSPDGTKVAFNLWSGNGSAAIAADGRSLVVMDIAKVNDTTYSFTNARALYKSDNPAHRPGWPYFLPDSKGLVFEREVKEGTGGRHFTSTVTARGELWWTDLEGHAHPLSRANGEGYLPEGPGGHEDDATLQYDPTVAPIVAGGYAWVVFTSRRLYGNVATRPPFESDPRDFDLTPNNPGGPTTKKLWISALEMPPKPGADPSHPAFYLPAQELFAGNTRGFWVLDACKPDLAECTGGDECCNGYCRREGDAAKGICGDIPKDQCAMEYDRCNVNADCCQDQSPQLSCIANRCGTIVTPG